MSIFNVAAVAADDGELEAYRSFWEDIQEQYQVQPDLNYNNDNDDFIAYHGLPDISGSGSGIVSFSW